MLVYILYIYYHISNTVLYHFHCDIDNIRFSFAWCLKLFSLMISISILYFVWICRTQYLLYLSFNIIIFFLIMHLHFKEYWIPPKTEVFHLENRPNLTGSFRWCYIVKPLYHVPSQFDQFWFSSCRKYQFPSGNSSCDVNTMGNAISVVQLWIICVISQNWWPDVRCGWRHDQDA